MSPLEEMVETFERAWGPAFAEAMKQSGVAPNHEACVAGLLAVLEKHVGPMLEDAYAAGQEDGVDIEWGNRGKFKGEHDYAARIIAQLTKQNERTG